MECGIGSLRTAAGSWSTQIRFQISRLEALDLRCIPKQTSVAHRHASQSQASIHRQSLVGETNNATSTSTSTSIHPSFTTIHLTPSISPRISHLRRQHIISSSDIFVGASGPLVPATAAVSTPLCPCLRFPSSHCCLLTTSHWPSTGYFHLTRTMTQASADSRSPSFNQRMLCPALDTRLIMNLSSPHHIRLCLDATLEFAPLTYTHPPRPPHPLAQKYTYSL